MCHCMELGMVEKFCGKTIGMSESFMFSVFANTHIKKKTFISLECYKKYKNKNQNMLNVTCDMLLCAGFVDTIRAIAHKMELVHTFQKICVYNEQNVKHIEELTKDPINFSMFN